MAAIPARDVVCEVEFQTIMQKTAPLCVYATIDDLIDANGFANREICLHAHATKNNRRY